MRGIVPLAVLALGACGNKDDHVDPAPSGSAIKHSSSDKLVGTITIGGARVSLDECRPGHAEHTYVEVITSQGKLRFEDGTLYWNRGRDSIMRGDDLTCDKLDRSWGGGVRADHSAYWRGKLTFRCSLDNSAIEGDLDLDCGDITADERAQLDGNRKDMLDQQRDAGATR